MCCTPRALFSCGSRSQKPGCVWRDTKLLESNHVTLLSSSTSSSRTSTQQSASGLGPADPSQARLGVVPREGHKLGSFRPGEQPTSSSRRRTLSSHDVVADGRVTRSWRFTYRRFPQLPRQVRERVLHFAQGFAPMLEKAKQWDAQGIPPSAWYSLLLPEG